MSKKRSSEEAEHIAPEETSTHKPLRPLLPKKGWQPLKVPLRSRRNNQISTLHPSRGCLVPGCQITDCALRTHISYRRTSRSPSSEAGSIVSATSDVRDNLGGKASTAVPKRKPRSEVPFNSLHGLEGLPDSIGDTPVLRKLFHEFFSQIYDRILTLLSPPPLDQARKQACLTLAMTSPAYCLNAITSVENEAVMRRKGAGSTAVGAMLYGKVMTILRQQISYLAKAPLATTEIENLLMIICTLAVFEIVNDNVSNLEAHRKGMVQLVSKVGGVHNLIQSMPIVLNLDRIIAIYSGGLPAFGGLIERSIQKPSKYAEVYGGYFNTYGRASIDRDVCDFCCDVSRALELFEGARISFDPAIARKILDNDVFYFYFSRQRVADHFTFLHHRCWSLPSRSRCVLLATKIVDYVILVDNYLNVIPGFLASKIKETLESLSALDTWKGQEDLLIWILSVLVTVPQPPCTNEWALGPLRKLLITKYTGFSGPSSWIEEELESMKRFVWCTSRLDERFLEVCNRLAGSSSVLKVSYRNRVDELVDTDSNED